MELISKIPRGTKDILPKDSFKWQLVENIIKEIVHTYGYKEIRTPIFEHTNLFKRSAGENTDVVQKEMYTFEDKSGRSITLRPEGTAGVARAVLENGLHNKTLPLKLYYFDSCYRYEKPQNGRYREFNQFGVECFGANSPTADAELISLANSIFEALGIHELRLNLNSIGCPECRKNYYTLLREYFNEHLNQLCELCKKRFESNPMRILDCKNDCCHKISKNAPTMLENLCTDCAEHFSQVKNLMDIADIKYEIDSTIVRGLDYYTKTVFEFVYDTKDGPLTVCGGGRYDDLTEQLGGPKISSLGFGLGMERLLDVISAHQENFNNIDYPGCELYLASLDDKANAYVFSLAEELRSAAIHVECDLNSKSLKAQLRYADKIGAVYSLVVGSDEIKNNEAVVKSMQTDEKFTVRLDSNFVDDYTSNIIGGFGEDF